MLATLTDLNPFYILETALDTCVALFSNMVMTPRSLFKITSKYTSCTSKTRHMNSGLLGERSTYPNCTIERECVLRDMCDFYASGKTTILSSTPKRK